MLVLNDQFRPVPILFCIDNDASFVQTYSNVAGVLFKALFDSSAISLCGVILVEPSIEEMLARQRAAH